MAAPQIGVPELIVLAVVGLVVAGGIISIVIVLLVRGRNKRWMPPERTGPATKVRAMDSRDVPLSEDARWDRDELEVRTTRSATVHLFDVPVSKLEQCVILYRARIKAESLKSSAYAEMWCHVAGHGKFFSKGLDQRVSKIGEWQTVEIPFYLTSGQQADLLNLNLVFDGAGVVRLKEIEIQSAPVKESVISS
jgi:hypothetical protein